MTEDLTRCGYRCDMCLAYRPNVEANPSNRQILSDGWHKYFGFRMPPEAIECDGCKANDLKRIDQSCPVRPCVIQRGFSNCAECEVMHSCDKLAQRLVVYEDIAADFSSPIPEEDRIRFITPYENKVRLLCIKAQKQKGNQSAG